MYRLDKTFREKRFLNHAENPSFSSTLLDEIYRSIDEGEAKSGEMKFYREAVGKKQSKSSGKCDISAKDAEVDAEILRRAHLLEKRTQWNAQTNRKLLHDHDHEHDAMFFSSTSSSSESSSGRLSSSDTESLYGVRSRASCFAPLRPKPVKTSVSLGSEKPDKTLSQRRHSDMFHEQKGMRVLDGYPHSSNAGRGMLNEGSIIKSKSRALKIYNNLKKVKQPISPGGKLTNFLNSLFTTGNTKKTKTPSSLRSYEDVNAERKAKSGQASTCSSASSFSRSCLSKTPTSSREKLRNGVKRTVRFYPVSVIVDEDSRPCGHKCLYEEDDTSLMSVSVPTAWKIGRSQSKRNHEEFNVPAMEKSKRVEEAAREFLKEYHRIQKIGDEDNEDDDDDDAASYSSSDLFELDHLAVMGKNRYCEELPVYETTHVSASRLIM